MGVWQNLKAMFGLNRDIGVSEDISGYLIFPLKLKHKKLQLNRKIIVPENFALAIVSEGRVLDCFPAGEHMLGVVSLPECSKQFRLYKPDKDGKPINEFPCEVYYINLAIQEKFPFEIQRKIKFKTSVDGRYWIKPKGEFSFRVKDYRAFLACVLKEMPKIKIKKLDKVLKGLFEDDIFKTFSKENYFYSSFTDNIEFLEEEFIPKLNSNLDKKGVEVSRIDFLSHDVSAKITKREEQKRLLEEENLRKMEQENLQNQENLSQNLENEIYLENALENNKKENTFDEIQDNSQNAYLLPQNFEENLKPVRNENWRGLESFDSGDVNLKSIGAKEDYQTIHSLASGGGANADKENPHSHSTAQFGRETCQTKKAVWNGIEEVNKAIKSKKFVDLDNDKNFN